MRQIAGTLVLGLVELRDCVKGRIYQRLKLEEVSEYANGSPRCPVRSALVGIGMNHFTMDPASIQLKHCRLVLYSD